jgi:hypothetical protein
MAGRRSHHGFGNRRNHTARPGVRRTSSNSASVSITSTAIIEASARTNALHFEWQSETAPYQLQQITNLAGASWQDAGEPTTETTAVAPLTGTNTFFRVKSVPNLCCGKFISKAPYEPIPTGCAAKGMSPLQRSCCLKTLRLFAVATKFF